MSEDKQALLQEVLERGIKLARKAIMGIIVYRGKREEEMDMSDLIDVYVFLFQRAVKFQNAFHKPTEELRETFVLFKNAVTEIVGMTRYNRQEHDIMAFESCVLVSKKGLYAFGNLLCKWNRILPTAPEHPEFDRMVNARLPRRKALRREEAKENPPPNKKRRLVKLSEKQYALQRNVSVSNCK